jgi:hypothetical protein
LKYPNRNKRPIRVRYLLFLLFYRWLSLSVPLVAWLLEPESTLFWALLVATAVNGLISFFSTQLNQTLRHRPRLLTADLVLMAASITPTGGWQTPFRLSPAANPTWGRSHPGRHYGYSGQIDYN